jgi:nucleotide-binding universal stress UspA family protein
MYKRILVALDGEPAGERILSWVRRLARHQHATVRLLVTREPSKSVTVQGRTIAFADQLDDAGRVQSQAYLGRLAADLRAAGIGVETEVRIGEAGGEIAAAAEGAGADLIVLAPARPKSRWAVMTRGIPERVLATARCPVLMAAPHGRRFA